VVQFGPIPSRRFVERTFSSMNAGSQRASILNLVTTAFGSGILSLPWAFAQVGLMPGAVMLSLGGVASYMSLKMLANSGYATSKTNYTEVVESVLGTRTSQALQVLLLIYAVGSVIGYFIFLGTVGPQVMSAIGAPPFFTQRTNLLLAMAVFPIYPMSCGRTISSFRYLAMLSVCTLIVVMAYVVAETPRLVEEHPPDLQPLLLGKWDVRTFLSSVAIVIYSYCCHINMFASSFQMNEPTPRRVDKILRRSVFVEFVVYFFVGACGVISWGEHTPPVITTSYPMDAMGTTARACVMITLFVCIPINLFAARGVLYERLATVDEEGEVVSYSAPLPIHLLVTTALLGLCVGVAVVEESIVAVLSILGGGCAVTFMFVLPMLCSRILLKNGAFGRSPNSIGRVTDAAALKWRIRGLSVVVALGYLSALASFLTMVGILPAP